jgi:hypothetical protein
MARKGEAGAASAAPPASDSDANSSAVRVRLDPDILMASISGMAINARTANGFIGFTAA